MNKQVPFLRGGYPSRGIGFMVGLFLVAYGIVAILEADLGLSPWDVLHQGVEKNTPLSFGVATIVVSVFVVLIAWALGHRPGLGTLANFVIVGLFIDLLIWTNGVPTPDDGDYLSRITLLLLGILLFGAGTALYIGANMGAGPRDSLMLVTATRANVRVGASRVVLELLALLCGWALGGTVGVGTLAFAILIGWSVEISFALLRRSPLAIPRGEVEPRFASGR